MASKIEIGIATNKKETILEKINKRNKDRQNYLETKLELRNRDNHEIEDADYFSQTFTERIKSIEYNINNAQPGNKIDLTKQFANINNDIQELQKYLSQSTLFLPDYNIKACQNIINELTAKAEEVRLRLLPKKKFGFNNKKSDNSLLSSSPKHISASIKLINNDTIDKQLSNPIVKSKLSTTNMFTWTLSKRQNEYILLSSSEVNSQDLTISNLDNCLVEIKGYAGSLQISNCKNTIFLCGPISRSLFAENCINCTFAAACQQLRLHSSVNCKIWLHVTCRAIIEDCNKIDIGKYNYEYIGIENDFKKSGIDPNINNYTDIADFNWLSPDKPSPNWQLVSENKEIQADWLELKEKFREKILKL